jgi:hypothetical protein
MLRSERRLASTGFDCTSLWIKFDVGKIAAGYQKRVALFERLLRGLGSEKSNASRAKRTLYKLILIRSVSACGTRLNRDSLATLARCWKHCFPGLSIEPTVRFWKRHNPESELGTSLWPNAEQGPESL